MPNSIHAAFLKLPFQGGMYSIGRLLTRMDIGFMPLLSSRPKSLCKKGGLKPHGYWLHTALTYTTSLQTYRLLGRLLSGRKKS